MKLKTIRSRAGKARTPAKYLPIAARTVLAASESINKNPILKNHPEGEEAIAQDAHEAA